MHILFFSVYTKYCRKNCLSIIHNAQEQGIGISVRYSPEAKLSLCTSSFCLHSPHRAFQNCSARASLRWLNYSQENTLLSQLTLLLIETSVDKERMAWKGGSDCLQDVGVFNHGQRSSLLMKTSAISKPSAQNILQVLSILKICLLFAAISKVKQDSSCIHTAVRNPELWQNKESILIFLQLFTWQGLLRITCKSRSSNNIVTHAAIFNKQILSLFGHVLRVIAHASWHVFETLALQRWVVHLWSVLPVRKSFPEQMFI